MGHEMVVEGQGMMMPPPKRLSVTGPIHFRDLSSSHPPHPKNTSPHTGTKNRNAKQRHTRILPARPHDGAPR